MLLDTGAAFAILGHEGGLTPRPLTPEVEAGWLKRGVIRAPTADGAMSVSMPSQDRVLKVGVFPGVQIQKWRIAAGQPALQADIGQFASATDVRFDGVVGIESMRALTWRADYVSGTLSAYGDEAPAHDWQQCVFMTFGSDAGLPMIDAGLDGGEAGQLGIDTGDSADLQLGREAFEWLRAGRRFSAMGLASSSDASSQIRHEPSGLLSGVSIGQRMMPKLEVTPVDPFPQHVGLGLLSKMDRVELDFRHFRFCFDMPAKPVDSKVSWVGAALVRAQDGYPIVCSRSRRTGGSRVAASKQKTC
ncbi:hypothetical protein D7S86_12925 [Pararobbsia silviterrae]|uniref:Peptidase A2 domain-containing protein n=2 Tax=Pararobbsia silviterrae TaxID=1792498 RepID=A0A494Y3T6_9BURK|nr:hypothetical protein D7S86_12925 [Pararobbsia silviterrae]